VKKLIASGFGIGLIWEKYLSKYKGGGTLASAIFAILLYIVKLEVLTIAVITGILYLIYYYVVSDEDAQDDPSWITLDEMIGMGIASLSSPSEGLPLFVSFLVFRISDILKEPSLVREMEKIPGKKGVLYDDVVAGVIGLIAGSIVRQFIT
jgi:phosphatidylglycerophosphatase A